jgi:hypothetical protein
MISPSRRFEAIMGFAAAGLAGIALRDTLRKISLIGCFHADHYLMILLALMGFCVWLIAIEYVIDSSPFRLSNLKRGMGITADAIFAFTVFSPIIVAAIALAKLTTSAIETMTNSRLDWANLVFSLVAVSISITSAVFTSIVNRKERRENRTEEEKDEEESSIKTAERLINDGFPAQAVLEIFKAIESHFRKRLAMNDLDLSQHNISQLLRFALKYELLDIATLNVVEHIRQIRNAVAHKDTKVTMEEAQEAFNFARQLVNI